MSSKNTSQNKGSEWRKWDLHVHSPASDGYTGTWDEFEKQLVDAECEVIGINDYNSIAGYKKIKEKIEKEELDLSGKVILPVIEFRMTESVQNKNTDTNGVRHFNFHILFDTAIDVEDIENLIKGLKSNGTKISGDYDDPAKLKEKKVSLKDLLAELDGDSKFSGKYLLWLPYDEYGGIDEIDPQSDGWLKENYINMANILGSSRPKQIDFFLWKSDIKTDGTPKFTQAQFQGWFSSKKPCVKGSDAHEKDYPIGKLRDGNSNACEKYCWIKADPSFEGLKQIVYEPETRIYIGEQKPKEPVNKIDTITLKIDSAAKVGTDQFCFAGEDSTYTLSPYFNCFIGGRGSGKSTILNFLGQYSNTPDSPKLFWEKLKPDFNPSDNDLFSFTGTENFEYLAQSEIESFARDKNKFTQAIYNRANAHAGNALNAYESKIENYHQDLDKVILTIERLKKANAEKSEKEKEKRTLESSIKVVSSEDYKKVVGEITEKSESLQNLVNSERDVNELKDALIEFLGIENEGEDELPDEEQNISGYQQAYRSAISKLHEALELLGDDKFVEERKQRDSMSKEVNELEEKVHALLAKANLSDENIEQIKSAPQKVTILSSEITDLENEISSCKAKLEEQSEITQKLANNRSLYEQKIVQIIEPLVKSLKAQSQLNSNNDIKEITLEYYFDENSAWERLSKEFFNYFRGNNQDRNGLREPDVCTFITDHKNVFAENDIEKVRSAIKSANKDNRNYINFLNEIFLDEKNFIIFQALRDKHIYDVETYKVINVKYNGRDIEQASFGQRCTAVIVILILFGNYPLIIDEPEAHLDSSLIANYLVPLIKEKKADRQIIFATHNANFVVNGDAEKVFILKNDTGTTDIIETTIEDLTYRGELMKLEGGKEAFAKRGEKLGI